MAAWPLIGWDIFDFFSETSEWNSTKLDRNQDLNTVYQVCVFRTNRKNKMAALASDWPRYFQLLLWNQIQWNLIGSKISMPTTKFVFFGMLGKSKWPPWLLIGWDIFDFSSETAEHIQRNLTGSKLSMPSTTFVFFRQIGKKQNGRPGLWLAETFRLLLWNCERNSMKLDRKQDLNALYLVCVFQVDRKNKMAALAYDLLRHFQLFLWNRWIEFNKTWQEARSQHPLPGLHFSGWSEKQDSHPVLWLSETFFDFSYETTERNSTKLDRKQVLNVLYQVCAFRADPKNNMAALASDWLRHILTFLLKPLNGIQRNLTGSKILTSSTKFVFFGRKVNKYCHPGQSIKEGGRLYSGARYGALWASCLWIYLGEVRGVHQFMYMYGNT